MLEFWKYQALGNDFVIIDARKNRRLIRPQEARFICDRRFGVGADGVLTLLPSERAALRLHLYNSDGSEPEMCGNGMRCVAKHVLEEQGGERLAVETPAGIIGVRAERGSDGQIENICLEMGAAHLDRKKVPLAGEGRFVDEPIELAGVTVRATAVFAGAPHLVIFGEADQELARELGPALENHALFPRRINVDFARVKSREEIDLVVWERGCGLTLACGTGACATVAAACLLGRVDAGRRVRVNLPGGTLWVEAAADLSALRLYGPARRVFSGRLEGMPG
jgi:diaminopimelate epimerase